VIIHMDEKGEVANQKRRGCTDVSAGVLWHDGVNLAAVLALRLFQANGGIKLSTHPMIEKSTPLSFDGH
jgi:hypothetical protein